MMVSDPSDYWAWTVSTAYFSESGTVTGDDDAHGVLTAILYWYDGNGYLIDSVSIEPYGITGRWEIIRQSDSLYLRINGDNKGIIGVCDSDIGLIKIALTATADSGYDGTTGHTAHAYSDYIFDDVTTSSGVTAFCVDHTNDPQNDGTHTWTDSELYSHDDDMYVTWGGKTTPSSTFTNDELLLRIKEMSTGTIVNETSLKPAGASANSSNVAGTVQYNRTELFGTNYSLYQSLLVLGSSTLATDYIVWTFDDLGVATIVVEDEQYVYNQEVVATWNVTDMDTGDYTYEILTYSLYGEEMDSETVTTSTGNYSITPDPDTWDTGQYYVVMQATEKSTGCVSEIGYDVFFLTDGVRVLGNVYDATTSDTLTDATVSIYQNADWSNTTSGFDGNYSVDDLSYGLPMTFYASLTDYTHASWSFTPLESGEYDIDLYMFPGDFDLTGNSLYGLVVSSNYHQAIPNATVTITAGETEYQTTSSSTGYYYFEDIANGTYNLTSVATSYESVSEQVNVSADTRYDIEMEQRYTVTVHALDAETADYISEFMCYVDGTEYNTTSSLITIPSLEYGTYTFTVVANGYYSATRSFLIDEDKDIEFTLTATPTGYYEAHTVELVYMAYWGTRYDNVDVSVYEGHRDNVIVSGSPNESATLVTSGTTGDTGGITFQLEHDVTYTFYATCSDPEFTKISCFAPQDDRYYIFVNRVSFSDDNEPADEIYYGVHGEKVNLSTAQINASFTDISNSTTLAEFWVNDSSGSMLYYMNTTEDSGAWSTYVNVSNETYYTYFRIDTASLTEPKLITKTFTFFHSVHPVFNLGFTEQWQYHIVFAIVLLLVVAMFGVNNVHLGGIVAIAMGWLALYIGYLEASVMTGLVLSVATLIAGGFYMRKQEAY
jgi:hypothetical protein